MENIPDGAVLIGGRESHIRLVESDRFGRIAIVGITEYALGESMGAIAKRTGAGVVLLVADDSVESMPTDAIENEVASIFATAKATP